MAQVADDQLLAVLDGGMNSIAVIVTHMTGEVAAPPRQGPVFSKDSLTFAR